MGIAKVQLIDARAVSMFSRPVVVFTCGGLCAVCCGTHLHQIYISTCLGNRYRYQAINSSSSTGFFLFAADPIDLKYTCFSLCSLRY